MDDHDLHLVDRDALDLCRHEVVIPTWATDSPLIEEMVMDIFLQPYIGCVSFAILRKSLDYMLPYRDIIIH